VADRPATNQFKAIASNQQIQINVMYDIYMAKPSEDFLNCYCAAGRHLQKQEQESIFWIKATPSPPFLEHLSFRLGNQLFYIHLVDVDERLDLPGTLEGLLRVAHECQAHPCHLPMKRRLETWSPVEPGWGLVHAETGRPITPTSLVSSELIPITDWELHDIAVQVIRDNLKGRHQIMSWCPDPDVEPSIWFVEDHGPAWIIVKAIKYPAKSVPPPKNLKDIFKHCSQLSNRGYLAQVGVAANGQAEQSAPLPIYRGYQVYIYYANLEPLSPQS
jgi:hypothetical protein